MKRIIFLLITFLSAVVFSQEQTYWWNDAVFYEIFVRSFYDSDGNGKGDFQGLIEKLDYLNDGNPDTDTDLGITGIWLMPICESPSYHGYDVEDYRSVDYAYGTLNDFSEFMDSAHARGIRVVIDYVMNHSSSEHPWFVESASSSSNSKRSWYRWNSTNPGQIGPWGQTVWHERNGSYYYGLFTSGMPDLNYENPGVKTEMFDIAKFWIDTMKVDGFRLDAIKYLIEDGNILEDAPGTFQILTDFRNYYKTLDPQAMTVGEVWSSTSAISQYVDGTGIDFCFEFELQGEIINGVSGTNSNLVHNQMLQMKNAYPYLQYAPFLSNHDMDRIFSQIGNDMVLMKQLAAVYLTLPGIPFIYYGEEIGMTGTGDHKNIRTPMQWNDGHRAGFTTGIPWWTINSNYETFNVATMQEDSSSLWHVYQEMIELRNENIALRRGDYRVASASAGDQLVYGRSMSDHMVIVHHNMQNTAVEDVTLNMNSSYLEAGLYDVKDLVTGNDLGEVEINEYGGFVDFAPGITIGGRGTALYIVGTPIVNSVKNDEIPEGFLLEQNYPNPFNPVTKIKYSVGQICNLSSPRVTLNLYNNLGEKVTTLVDEIKAPGNYEVTWDASGFASGVYYYKLEADGYSETKKMTLLK